MSPARDHFRQVLTVSRLLVVTLLAAVSGPLVASLIEEGDINPKRLLLVGFTGVGSIILALVYSLARENGRSLVRRYVTVIVTGAVAGAAMLSMLPMPSAWLIGSFYGVVTAFCWVVLHLVSKQISRGMF